MNKKELSTIKGLIQDAKTKTFINGLKRFPFTIPGKILLAIVLLGIIGFGVKIGKQTFYDEPIVTGTYPENQGNWDGYTTPVTIKFDRPVNTKLLVYNISPDTAGKWEFKRIHPWVNLSKELTFTPNESFIPGEKIMIYISYITSIVNPKPGNEILMEFFAPVLPTLGECSIKDGAENVSLSPSIECTVNGDDGNQNGWSITATPETSFKIEKSEGKVIISADTELQQSTTYELKISKHGVVYELSSGKVLREMDMVPEKTLTFTTVKEPLIAAKAPEGNNIIPTTPITLEFDAEMDTESVESNFSIAPEVKGTQSWDEEGKKFTFSTEGLDRATSYKVTLKEGIRSKIGGKLINPVEFSFTTVGEIGILSSSPSNGSSNVDLNSQIRITFNQPVDKASAEQRFIISPSAPGSLSWDGYTLVFTHATPFNYETSYKATLATGVKAIYGYDSTKDLSIGFKTKAQIVMIDITWDGQDTPWTCNFAATKMALSAKGVHVEEATLISIAGTQPSFNFTTKTGGNPHKGYVYGYGTYWEPISKAAGQYRSVSVKEGWTISQACHEISNGNPIVTWGQNGWSTPTPRNWTAPDGEYITGYSGMHSVVIVGCEGDLDNPAYIYIQDPWRKWGNKITTSEMLSRWHYFNYTGMVVY